VQLTDSGGYTANFGIGVKYHVTSDLFIDFDARYRYLSGLLSPDVQARAIRTRVSGIMTAFALARSMGVLIAATSSRESPADLSRRAEGAPLHEGIGSNPDIGAIPCKGAPPVTVPEGVAVRGARFQGLNRCACRGPRRFLLAFHLAEQRPSPLGMPGSAPIPSSSRYANHELVEFATSSCAWPHIGDGDFQAPRSRSRNGSRGL